MNKNLEFISSCQFNKNSWIFDFFFKFVKCALSNMRVRWPGWGSDTNICPEWRKPSRWIVGYFPPRTYSPGHFPHQDNSTFFTWCRTFPYHHHHAPIYIKRSWLELLDLKPLRRRRCPRPALRLPLLWTVFLHFTLSFARRDAWWIVKFSSLRSSVMLSSHLFLGLPLGRRPCVYPCIKIFGYMSFSMRVTCPK